MLRRALLAETPGAVLGARLASGAGLALAACAGNKEDAAQLAVNWFVGELKRVGYADKGGGVYATPPKAASGLLLGDALEAQIREVKVSSVRETALSDADRQRDVTWRGQVYLGYELREQYHKDSQPKGWSDWKKQTSTLSLEKRNNQWYISRLS